MGVILGLSVSVGVIVEDEELMSSQHAELAGQPSSLSRVTDDVTCVILPLYNTIS